MIEGRITLDPRVLSAGDLRQASDGWHAVLNFRGAEHRLWLKARPIADADYLAELPFDAAFEVRAHAARRLWRALNGRSPGPPIHVLTAQQRHRLALALRALDAQMSGASYRAIAEVLFGVDRISERAWKTHDLRSRTIRLVQHGLGLMRGGYRQLLQYTRIRRRP